MEVDGAIWLGGFHHPALSQKGTVRLQRSPEAGLASDLLGSAGLAQSRPVLVQLVSALSFGFSLAQQEGML